MIRGKKAEEGWLTASWDKKEKDIIFNYPNQQDGGLMYGVLCCTSAIVGLPKTLIQELENRGYDISTLQFSVKRKWKPNERPS